MQAIILAGGFGTRLQSVVKDLPKPLAPINNKPFLFWLIKHLEKNGVTKFVFSLGYMHELVMEYLKNEFSNLDYSCVVENEPLGTGGAIKFCLNNITSNEFLVINGDSFFNLDIKLFYSNHLKTNSDCSIALKPMENFDRYGSVEIDEYQRILQFNEKKYCKKGLINSGILIFNKDRFLQKTNSLSQNFSYEKDFLEPNIATLKVTGFISNGYFIDIGIPEDYYKADEELSLVIGY